MTYDQLTILLVDDDPDDWEIFQEGLKETAPAHVLRWVKHGDHVVAGVRELYPDIVFLDLNIPGANGLECLKLIKEDPSLQNTPVVIYTTSSAPDQVKECYGLGASRYLLKPVSYSGIFKGIEIILNLHQAKNLTRPDFESFVIDTYRIS